MFEAIVTGIQHNVFNKTVCQKEIVIIAQDECKMYWARAPKGDKCIKNVVYNIHCIYDSENKFLPELGYKD